MKMTPLVFIQMAWVIEVAALVVQTVAAYWVCLPLGVEGVSLFQAWLVSVSPLGMLIAAQGAAASIGPLVADKIKKGA